jgi:hypothetical protein
LRNDGRDCGLQYANNHVKELANFVTIEVTLDHRGKHFVVEESDAPLYLVEQGMIVSLLVWRAIPEQRSAWIGAAEVSTRGCFAPCKARLGPRCSTHLMWHRLHQPSIAAAPYRPRHAPHLL